MAAGFAALVFVGFCFLLPHVFSGQEYSKSWTWVESLNINFSIWLDGLSLYFALLISGIGALVLYYSRAYFRHQKGLVRFQLLMLLFMFSMLGLVGSGDLISFYVFWEMTTLSSFLLIGFEKAHDEARHAAKQALLVTSAAGLCLLAGFILLSQITGTFDIATILKQGETIRGHKLYDITLILILIGALAKSAQFPFQFWLPSAMAAPTPVSAYLHSATMVKAGIFLLARFTPALSGTSLWTSTLFTAGVLTMAVSAVLSWFQKDLKKLLAYLTILILGLLVALFGISGEEAVHAALLYLFAHALYKAALFLCAGIIDQVKGTRTLTLLSGLFQTIRTPSIALVLAAFSMIGLIPFLGFIGKEMSLKSLSFGGGSWILTAVMIFVTAAAGVMCLRPLTGEVRPPTPYLRVTWRFWIAPLILSVLGLAFGILPEILNPLIKVASASVLQHPTEVHLKLWHGFNREFWLSLTSIGLGALFYFLLRNRLPFTWMPKGAFKHLHPEAAFENGLEGLNQFALHLTNRLQNGRLRFYLYTLFGFFLFLIALANRDTSDFSIPQNWSSINLYDLMVLALIIAGSLTASMARSVLAVFVGLGTSGYGIALTFLLYSMPDLALTQFLIETITVIFIALVFVRLPSGIQKHKKVSRKFDVPLAAAVGGVMCLLIFQNQQEPQSTHVVDFYTQYAALKAHGHNIVNVILVDFRALDTLGEATVVLLAAAGVASLYRLKPKRLRRRV